MKTALFHNIHIFWHALVIGDINHCMDTPLPLIVLICLFLARSQDGYMMYTAVQWVLTTLIKRCLYTRQEVLRFVRFTDAFQAVLVVSFLVFATWVNSRKVYATAALPRTYLLKQASVAGFKSYLNVHKPEECFMIHFKYNWSWRNRTWRKYAQKHHTISNPSSGSNQGPRSCKATLPPAPPYPTKLIF